jgi:hypothetical protein
MERVKLQSQLAAAERQVAQGADAATLQRALVERAKLMGGDVGTAQSLLSSFEEIQARHIAQRDRLKRELEHYK